MQRNRVTGNSSPAPWQEAVTRDRAGDGSSSARSRPFPSHSLPPRPLPPRPPAAPSNSFASPLPASHPFASPLPASNPFALPASKSIASRLRATRPLSAPGDGSSQSSSTSEPTEEYQSSASSTASSYHSSLFTSEEDISEQTKAKRAQHRFWYGDSDGRISNSHIPL